VGNKEGNHLINFGNRLRAFREKANLSQDQIQYATGVTQTQISKIESGKTNPEITTVYRLAELFGQDHQLLILNSSVPSSTELQKNINRYLRLHDIDPEIFIRKGLTRMIKVELEEGKFFNAPKLTMEISKFLKDKHKILFTTSRISDTLEELKKKGFIEKIPTDKKSKYLYKKRAK
jgi:transcriptional regulator with XRE-family HTH domain